MAPGSAQAAVAPATRTPQSHEAAAPPVGGIEEFERHARLYDWLASPFTVPLFRLAHGRIAPLPSGAAVLDLGCGPGRELAGLLLRSGFCRVSWSRLAPGVGIAIAERAGRHPV